LLGSAVGGRVLTVYGFGVLTPLSIAIVVCGLVLALGNPAAFPHALPASAQED
ncbi:MAG: MFS transporter, partial [Komagataeibacter rhaeticus]